MNKMSTEEIFKNFKEVMADVMELKREDVELKHKKFKSEYPKIFEMAIDAIVSGKVQEYTERLQSFLKTVDDMMSNKISRENADMFIGNKLGNEYIYTMTGKPSEEDYKRAVKKVKGEYVPMK